MANYLIQVIAFQIAFLIVYDVLLKRETFFNWNRFYLLGTILISVCMPLIRIDNFKHVVPQKFIVNLPEVVIGDVTPETHVITPIQDIGRHTNTFLTWDTIIIIGAVLAAIIFVFKISKLLYILFKNPKEKVGNLVIVKLLNSNAAFSFFNYVFLGEQLNEASREAILKHETIHVKHKHTLDLLFFEAFRILFWFNPLVYIYQNRIMSLHEFIADAEVVKQQDKLSYYQNLLSQVFQTKNISFINPFFKQSLIKKRIVMLQKSKSKQVNLLKYALLLPITVGMLIYSSSNAQDKITENTETNTNSDYQELVDKYYKEAKENESQITANFITIPIKDKYILSKDELARKDALLKLAIDNIISKKKEEGTLTEDDLVKYEKMLKYKTYEDYLNYKNTEEAKQSWENKSSDGILRLVVADANNLTEAEKKRKEDKMALLKRDDYFHTLITTDGYITTRLEFNKLSENNSVASNAIVLEVPFSAIDKAPIFPGCEKLSNDEQKDCFRKNIQEHVSKNYNINIAKEHHLAGRQRISVIFKINAQGNITDINARAPHQILEVEAKRVLELLPKMIPGEQKGEKVNVVYSLPIVFQVADDNPTTNKE